MTERGYFFGFSRWKRKHIRPFFPEIEICFCTTLEEALRQGMVGNSPVYIWGKKPFLEVETYVEAHASRLFRVEDGFIRSVSLGSDLTKAYSLVVDGRGIYFDPSRESDLEYLLSTASFSSELLERGRQLQQYLEENRISKYNLYRDRQIVLEGLKKAQRVALVPGQVEDDASIIYGAGGMSNLELLQQAREKSPDAYIVYKPHPDVLAGNRKGHIETTEALQYADSVIEDASLDSVLARCDEVHTLTSLVGFEALIRGKEVYTYGMPFYAGWGVTVDAKRCRRRSVRRTVDEIAAAALILYPRYIHPKTNRRCEIETLLQEIDKEKTRYNNDKLYQFCVDIRNGLSRKIQFAIKVMLGE